MVKAYLRYAQEKVIGGLTGNLANAKLCKLRTAGGVTKGLYVASASNEVVNFSNVKTGEVEFQIYDKEAMHGQVTTIATSSDMIAIGYTSGTVLIYSLEESNPTGVENTAKVTESAFDQLHQFSFHRSAVTTLLFSDENTQLVSGGADTYIVLYDLITSTAEFKLMGHTEPIT